MELLRAVPESEYHSWDLMSASALKVLDKSTPLHLTASKEEREDTPAFRIGRALHARVLTPEVYGDGFVVAPDVDRRTKAGKEEYERFVAGAVGKTVLSYDDSVLVEAMRASICNHRSAKMLVDACGMDTELTLRGTWRGVQCKARIDGWIESTGTIIDVKTHSGLASPQEFARASYNFGYWTQFAFYRELLRAAGKEVSNVVLIVVEKSKPHAVMCAGMHEDGLDSATARLPEMVDLYNQYVANPTKGWSDDVLEIRIPAWAQNDLLAPTGD